METSEALTTFAELAMALAGFTGLLTAFQRKQVAWSDQERFRIRMLLMVCFGIMAFALAPGLQRPNSRGRLGLWHSRWRRRCSLTVPSEKNGCGALLRSAGPYSP